MRDNRANSHSRFLNLLSRFKEETSGSVQIMGAAGLMMGIMTISMTLDIARISQASQKLTILSDNATLAAASDLGLTKKKREKIFKSMVIMNMKDDGLLENLTYQIKIKDTPARRL